MRNLHHHIQIKERKMKKTTKRNLTIILCAILLSSSLASCSRTSTDDTPSDKPTIEQQTFDDLSSGNESATQAPSGENVSDVQHDISQDRYEEQIKYYMDLTESLKADLLKLKEETYIDECEYQLQIATLEQTIQNLKDTISALNQEGNKLPTSSDDTPTPDKIVAKSAFKYTTEGGQVRITGYNGTDIDVEIPSNIDGLPVTSIGEEAFKNALIRSVVIPSSVRSIDWFAFSGCTCLESVTLPSSVLSVGYGAFDHCPKSMEVVCDKGSYAEAYALSWGMKVVAK